MERKIQSDRTDLEVSEEPGITLVSSVQPFSKVKKISKNRENAKIPEKRYNKNYIRLFARDPHNLFTYWEITNSNFYEHQPLLRLIDEIQNNYLDIEISHHCDNWYIKDVKENSRYKVAIGYKKNNIFYPLCFSRTINTPPAGPSAVIDEKWMSIKELNEYTYRIKINSSLSLLKSLKKRERKEEIKAGSLSFTRRK